MGIRISKDKLQLLRYSLETCLLIAGWWGITSLSHNSTVQFLSGWVGFGAISLYWRWLPRKKV
jgi:hypothetical protein